MEFGKSILELRETFGRILNLVFIPIRLPGALFSFALDEFTRWEQERTYNRNVVKRGLVPQGNDSPFSGDQGYN